MLVAGSEPDQLSGAGIQPHPEGTPPRGAPQMLGDRGPHLPQRRADMRRGAPAVTARVRWCEPQRVAGVVAGNVFLGDLDRRGDVGEQRPRTGSASAAAATLPISSRAVTSGSSSASVGASRAFSPRAATSTATTLSVTINWVSQRRSCRPSLVPLVGSAAARGPLRNRASRASTSSTATGIPATVATSRALMSRSPSPPVSRPADRRSRPGPAPTTGRVAATPVE